MLRQGLFWALLLRTADAQRNENRVGVLEQIKQDARLRSKPSFLPRMLQLKRLGFAPRGIFDVGANAGHWTQAMMKVWPRARYFMLEANPMQEPNLKVVGQPFAISLVGDVEKNITMWISPDRPSKTHGSTGNSIFREAAGVGRFVPTSRRMSTLDALAAQHGAVNFDMLKMDVQGAELLILRGAKTVLRSVQVVLLELGAVQYNQGAPMCLEVHLELDRLGFMAYDVLELHYDHRTQVLTQVDVLFVRKGSFLTRKRATGFPAPVLPDITCSVKASAEAGRAETPERGAGTRDHKRGPQSGTGFFGSRFG